MCDFKSSGAGIERTTIAPKKTENNSTLRVVFVSKIVYNGALWNQHNYAKIPFYEELYKGYARVLRAGTKNKGPA